MAAANVIFHRLAAEEYRSARRWYRRRNPGAAGRFQGAIDEALRRIAENPGQGALFRDRYRCVRPRRFPYVLYYEVRRPDIVVIFAVAHARRRQGYWLRRSKD